MSNSHEVRDVMVLSLAEWGVRPSASPEHDAFYEKAVQTAIVHFQGEGGSDNKDSDGGMLNGEKVHEEPENGLPTDSTAAIKYVLRSELTSREDDDKRFYITFDRLSIGPDGEKKSIFLGYPPYFHDNKSGRRRKKTAFLRYTEEEIDPLKRFIAAKVNKVEYVFHSWFISDVATGLAFEAIVTSHAVHNEKCFSCRRQKTLRWMGGSKSNSSWRDMICVACQSSYEIKSKETMEHINKHLRFNNVLGGSYYLFHKHIRHDRMAASGRSQKGLKQRRFLVLVSRKCTWLRSGKAVFPVEILEIDVVKPRLRDRSFSLRKGKLSIGSEIETKLSTRTAWFQVPMAQCDFQKVAMEVFDDFFSADERKRVGAKWQSGLIYREAVSSATEEINPLQSEGGSSRAFGAESKHPAPSNTGTKKNSKTDEVRLQNDVAKLTEELEGVCLGWEDSDSD